MKIHLEKAYYIYFLFIFLLILFYKTMEKVVLHGKIKNQTVMSEKKSHSALYRMLLTKRG